MHGDNLSSLLMLLREKENSVEVEALIALGKLLHNTFPLEINARHCMPAGYTYLGQFIDHDIIFSMNGCPVGNAGCQPPIGFESKLNLSAVYGAIQNRGVYEKLEYFDRPYDDYIDIPKVSNGLQPIPDARNNENLLISQLHLQFIKLHNKLIDEGLTFEQARNEAIAIYHSIVLNDYLKNILYDKVWEAYFGNDNPLSKSDIFYKPSSQQPIPKEFSKAAFRFGHSMIKHEYNINNNPGGQKLIRLEFMLSKSILTNSLHPKNVVDWELFFGTSDRYNRRPLNVAKAISPSFNLSVVEVGDNGLPIPDQPADLSLIAVRNLLRGEVENLDNFKVVATKIRDYIQQHGTQNTELQDIIEKMQLFMTTDEWLKPKLKSVSNNTSPAFCDLSPDVQQYILHNPPLWYGILCESHYFKGRNIYNLRTPGLGPVGSIIIAETFSHLLDLQQPRIPTKNIKTMMELLEFLKGA